MNKTKKQIAIEEHWAAVGVILFYGVRESGELGFVEADENGWASAAGLDPDPNIYEVLNNGHTCALATTLYRPKSLRGIENNNGWVEGLPPATLGDCWLQTKDLGIVPGHTDTMIKKGMEERWQENVTGWQPMQKPGDKIY